jgi:dipeptidyl-peptidase-4
VPDFYLLSGLAELRTAPLIEGYPKPGEPNPVAGLLIHDLETGQTRPIDTGANGDADTGHYVFNVRFSPDGRWLLFSRTNRHQNRLQVVRVDPESLETSVVVEEVQETWQENRPLMRFLADGRRFVWETERTGFRHFELRSLDGQRLATLTSGAHPVGQVVEIDETRGQLYYTAFTGASPLNAHLHRVGLDGTGDRRLTTQPLHHTVTISPDGRWFVARMQTLTIPPRTVLYDAEGREVATLAESDTSTFEELELEPAELFSFKADDGRTDLYGVLFKPSDFDPDRRYPLLIDVYGGPFSQRVRNVFRPVNPLCELGFLVARIDNRGTRGRGKAFEAAAYMKLGTVDLQDQADGVRALARRPYVDADRVGIFGHSYGGSLAALAGLKHPEVFHVAVAGSAVTDWRNYDTIYTERFMRTPQENAEGYEQGSCLTYAENLGGKLLLLHGMVDENVHPTNAWQLVDKLQEAGKPFDIMFFPRAGHGLGRRSWTMRLEYLHEHLIGGRD